MWQGDADCLQPSLNPAPQISRLISQTRLPLCEFPARQGLPLICSRNGEHLAYFRFVGRIIGYVSCFRCDMRANIYLSKAVYE